MTATAPGSTINTEGLPMLTATKEQVNPTMVIKTRADLKQAMSDLEFYAGLALTKGESLEMDLWAEVGKVVSPRTISRREVIKSQG